MTARTWRLNDPIAEHDGDTWRLGTVVGVDGAYVAIRFDGGAMAAFRHIASPHLLDPDDVPIDQRSWLPEKVRDQLVRQEAARALRAMAEHLPPGPDRVIAGIHLARHFDDLIGRPDPCYAEAARALLNPAPQPATTAGA